MRVQEQKCNKVG